MIVCVDAGTTVIKAVAFDDDGHERGTGRVATAVREPAPGRSEQDMDEVWAAVVTAVREAAAAGPVRALAVTAQGDGAWLVDHGGRPVRPAVLWNDARAAGVVEAWRRDGVLDEAFRRTGSMGNAGLPHAILAVLRDEEPDALARACSVLTCGSWLFGRLTGVWALDRSEASAPWLDVRTGCPDPALLDLHGIGDLARLVPPVVEGNDRVRGLGADAADALGLPEGLPVVMAPYDVAATAVGAGVTGAGEAVSILGTTLCTESVITALEAVPGPDAVASGLTLDLDYAGIVLRAFPTLAGTGVLEWTAGVLGLPGAAAVVELAGTVPAGADGLVALPYLSPAGERAPFLDPAVRGLVSGLTFAHGRSHIARAVLEGLAHVVRDCLEAAPGTAAELRLCGGGAGSDLWAQVIADVTGRATVRTTDSQVGAKGALIVALDALGEPADPAALVRVRDRREPDPAARALHDERHAAFLAMRGRRA